MDYCYAPVSGSNLYTFFGDYTDETTPGANISLTVSNAVDSTLPPLYTNSTDGVDGDPDGFRLQAEGKESAGGTRYYIDSPLIDAYDTGSGLVDVNPWDESTILSSIAFNNTTNLSDAFALSIIPNFQNPIEINDTNGNLENDYDAIRRRIEFQFGESYSTTNEEIWELIALISERGTKRFYPLDSGNSLFDDASSGTFSDTDNSLALTLSVPMITDHWRGYWVIIDSSDHYYINSNDSSKLYLSNKIESAFPSNGSHTFSIEYLLVKTPLETIRQIQRYSTNFTKGGRWREQSPDQSENYQYTMDKLAIFEVEDLREGIS
jgi:hypothetical protein